MTVAYDNGIVTRGGCRFEPRWQSSERRWVSTGANEPLKLIAPASGMRSEASAWKESVMISRTRICVAIAAAALATFGDGVAHSDFLQGQSADGSPQVLTGTSANPKPSASFGDPLPGLTTAQLADFAAGQDEFQDEDTPESGLGPIFNNVSCVACHSAPAPGGASAILETRFGRVVN